LYAIPTPPPIQNKIWNFYAWPLSFVIQSNNFLELLQRAWPTLPCHALHILRDVNNDPANFCTTRTCCTWHVVPREYARAKKFDTRIQRMTNERETWPLVTTESHWRGREKLDSSRSQALFCSRWSENFCSL
jgi:hypothetical protein